MTASLVAGAMDPQGLLALLQGRRSIRRFSARPISHEEIERVLEAARWAPSAGNRQALRFIAVTRPETIAAMGRAVAEAITTLSAQLRSDRRQAYQDYFKNFIHFADAPALIVPIYRPGVDLLARATDAGPAAVVPAAPPRPLVDGISSVSAAIMSLLLMAHACGLGACWMTGPLVAEGVLATILQIPGGWALAAVIPLGYPEEAPAAPGRRPLTALVRYIGEALEEPLA